MTSTLKKALILFVVSLTVYLIPLAYNALVVPFFLVVPSQDVVSTSMLPASILTRGNFYLDQYRKYIANHYTEDYFVYDTKAHLVSRYPAAASVLDLPFVGWGLGTGWIARTDYIFAVAKLAAALITACTVVAFFFCARQLTDSSTSFLVTVAFAFGTSVWSTASQALWQHTSSILFISLAILFLLRGQRLGASAVAPAGMFLALAFVCRPPTVVVGAVFALYVLIYYPRAVPKMILWGLPPVILTMIYNNAANGSPFIFGYQEGVLSIFSLPQWEAIQGLLFSPSRGIFILSPFLFLTPIGLWIGWRQQKIPLYAFFGLAFIAYVLIMAAWGSLGGWAYGARMLTDTLPYLCLLLIPVIAPWKGAPRIALWGVIGLCAFVQVLGLYDYGITFHTDPANSVWSIQNNEPLFYLKLYGSMIRERMGM